MTRMLIVAPELLLADRIRERVLDWLGMHMEEPRELELEFAPLEEPFVDAIMEFEPNAVAFLTETTSRIAELCVTVSGAALSMGMPIECHFLQTPNVELMINSEPMVRAAGAPLHGLVGISNGQVH